MNFLAHIYLSGKDEELIIGNFIADSVKGKKYLNYSPGIQKGILLHRAIDHYTDTHPVVRKGITRLFPTYGHYSGVIIDIFYDHFLASNWKKYSPVPLEHFILNFYDLLKKHHPDLPLPIQKFLPAMTDENWLLSYATIDGIGKILHQMNIRTKRRSGMDMAVVELKAHYREFQTEFTMFFEDLQKFTRDKLQTL